MTDFSTTRNEPITESYLRYMGFNNSSKFSQIYTQDGFENIIIGVTGKFYYNPDSRNPKRLKIYEDLNKIVLPIKNEAIRKRREALANER